MQSIRINIGLEADIGENAVVKDVGSQIGRRGSRIQSRCGRLGRLSAAAELIQQAQPGTAGTLQCLASFGGAALEGSRSLFAFLPAVFLGGQNEQHPHVFPEHHRHADQQKAGGKKPGPVRGKQRGKRTGEKGAENAAGTLKGIGGKIRHGLAQNVQRLPGIALWRLQKPGAKHPGGRKKAKADQLAQRKLLASDVPDIPEAIDAYTGQQHIQKTAADQLQHFIDKGAENAKACQGDDRENPGKDNQGSGCHPAFKNG